MLDNHTNNNIYRFIDANYDMFFKRGKEKFSKETLFNFIRYKFFKNDREFFSHVEDVIQIVEDYSDLSDLIQLSDIKYQLLLRKHVYSTPTKLSELKEKYRALEVLVQRSPEWRFTFPGGEPLTINCYYGTNNQNNAFKAQLHVKDADAEIKFDFNDDFLFSITDGVFLAINFFLEYASMNHIQKVEITCESFPVEGLFPVKTLHNIVTPLGFVEKNNNRPTITNFMNTIFQYKLSVKDFSLQPLETVIQLFETLEKFRFKQPAFVYERVPQSNLMNPVFHKDDTYLGYYIFRIHWDGYTNAISIYKENDEYYLEELNVSENNGSSKKPFLLKNGIEKGMTSFLRNIQEERKFPNLFSAPNHHLHALIGEAISYTTIDEPFIRKLANLLSEKGYPYSQVENEAARIVDDLTYFRYCNLRTPNYKLKQTTIVRDAIIRFLDGYLVLFHLEQYHNFAKQNIYEFAYTATQEEAEETLLSFAAKYEKDSSNTTL